MFVFTFYQAVLVFGCPEMAQRWNILMVQLTTMNHVHVAEKETVQAAEYVIAMLQMKRTGENDKTQKMIRAELVTMY